MEKEKNGSLEKQKVVPGQFFGGVLTSSQVSLNKRQSEISVRMCEGKLGKHRYFSCDNTTGCGVKQSNVNNNSNNNKSNYWPCRKRNQTRKERRKRRRRRRRTTSQEREEPKQQNTQKDEERRRSGRKLRRKRKVLAVVAPQTANASLSHNKMHEMTATGDLLKAFRCMICRMPCHVPVCLLNCTIVPVQIVLAIMRHESVLLP